MESALSALARLSESGRRRGREGDQGAGALSQRRACSTSKRCAGLRLVERLDRPASVAALKAAVDERPEIEGAVLRWDGGRRLLKVKGAGYVSAHRLRYELHPRKILAALDSGKAAGAEELCDRYGVGDAHGREYVAEVCAERARLEADLDAELTQLGELAASNAALSKKRFTRELAAPLGSPRAEALVELRRGEPEKARELLRRRWVNERFSEPPGERV